MDNYETGTRIEVRFTWASYPQQLKDAQEPEILSTLHLEILHAFTPFTTAPVCVVKVVGDGADEQRHAFTERCRVATSVDPLELVLKLYDRRHLNNDRKRRKMPYDSQKEPEYQQYFKARREAVASKAKTGPGSVVDADASRTFGESSIDDIELTDDEERIAFEWKAEQIAVKAFDTEAEVYTRLNRSSTLGFHPAVPFLFGHVEFASPIGMIRGLLLEYVRPAISVRDYLSKAAACGHRTNEVSDVCDELMRAAVSLMRFEFVNLDLELRDILLQQTHKGMTQEVALSGTAPIAAYRPKFIDFAIMKFRHEDETDREWLAYQAADGEEYALKERLYRAIKVALSPDCQEHGTDCWDGKEKVPAWSHIMGKEFAFVPTEEEQAVADGLLPIGGDWGLYDVRPYPRTLEELKALIGGNQQEGAAGQSALPHTSSTYAVDLAMPGTAPPEADTGEGESMQGAAAVLDAPSGAEEAPCDSAFDEPTSEGEVFSNLHREMLLDVQDLVSKWQGQKATLLLDRHRTQRALSQSIAALEAIFGELASVQDTRNKDVLMGEPSCLT